MPKDRFAVTPYSGLRVSEEERKQLIELADAFVQDGYQKYEDFVVVDKRQIDDKRWKYVKSKGNQHAYAERRLKEFDRKTAIPGNTASATQTLENVPVVMSVGTLVGELDDLMFGVVNPTLDTMRIKASYVHDFDSAAILHTLLEPTEDDPFRSLAIKWMTIDVPLQSTSIVKARDFVFMESTGIVQLADGNRVGYQLLHSIDFPQTKPLPGAIRGNFSYFGCYRQLDRNAIDMYASNTIAPGGDVMRFFSVKVAADALFFSTKLVYCGQMKKLSWMLQQQNSVSKHEIQGRCVMCDRKTASGIRGAIGSRTCKLCYGCVCYSCKISRRISFIELDGRLTQHKISFCSKCISKAITCDAKVAARDQTTGYRAYKAFSTSSQSDTTETSLFV